MKQTSTLTWDSFIFPKHIIVLQDNLTSETRNNGIQQSYKQTRPFSFFINNTFNPPSFSQFAKKTLGNIDLFPPWLHTSYAPGEEGLAHIPTRHCSSHIRLKHLRVVSQHRSCFSVQWILMIRLLHKNKIIIKRAFSSFSTYQSPCPTFLDRTKSESFIFLKSESCQTNETQYNLFCPVLIGERNEKGIYVFCKKSKILPPSLTFLGGIKSETLSDWHDWVGQTDACQIQYKLFCQVMEFTVKRWYKP